MVKFFIEDDQARTTCIPSDEQHDAELTERSDSQQQQVQFEECENGMLPKST